MISVRIGSLPENYTILEKLGLNVPYFIPIHCGDVSKAFENFESITNRSSNVGMRFDGTPTCTPAKFYSLVDSIYPECVYKEPRDRHRSRWEKNPHLIGEYEKIKEILLKLSRECEFSSCMDYEVDNPHYFQTQNGGFNLWVKDNTYVEGILGRNTVRSLEEHPKFIIEDGKITKGELPENMKNDIDLFTELVEKLSAEHGINDLIFENSYHSLQSGKLRNRIVAWDILRGGSPEGRQSIEKLRQMLL